MQYLFIIGIQNNREVPLPWLSNISQLAHVMYTCIASYIILFTAKDLITEDQIHFSLAVLFPLKGLC